MFVYLSGELLVSILENASPDDAVLKSNAVNKAVERVYNGEQMFNGAPSLLSADELRQKFQQAGRSPFCCNLQLILIIRNK
ncbi:hypothetical protein Zm00014a_019571 [Zea mays]|uniref:Uncharacterized protein n=1 Tax=Zea mays TaxID=4577 RepID=A0A3L6EQT1_MAIZE|nr:hypothetical protein Zm00014a_019571 [Zea mays]